MRIFVLRARKAPVSARRFLASVGGDAHVEVIAQTLVNALFLSRGHREEVVVHIVLESSGDFSRTVTITAAELGETGGFHEEALLRLVADALDKGAGLSKDASIAAAPGVTVSALSFERLVARLASAHPIYLLERKGGDLRTTEIGADPCFILSDHLKMPRKSLAGLRRAGATSISVGPRVLFAAQCVVLVHNELDRRAL